LSSSTLTIAGSIVAGNPNGSCSSIPGATQNPVDGGYNLTDDSSCGFHQASDLLNTNPQLRTLGNYGGPTQTMALSITSPAIDAIPTSSGVCPSTDQRGATRAADGESSCDIGAYESVAQTLSCPTYDQIKSALTVAAMPDVYLLTCPTGPDTIDFSAAGAGTITPSQSVMLDASGSLNPITFDGHGTTSLLNVTGGPLTLDGLNLSHGAGSTGTSGGAVSLNHGTLLVTNSTVSNNSAPSAGGILNHLGTLTVTNSTFSGNTATNYGGAIFNFGHTTISASTLSGNSAGAGGGGALFNNAGTLTIAASIIANSTTGGNCSNDATDGAILTSAGYNLTDDTTCGFTDGTNHDQVVGVGGADLASQLGWWGGPTQTLALLPGSLAIGAGDPAACGSSGVDGGLDQRGYTRHASTCDVGSFEAGARSDLGDLPASGPGITNLFFNTIQAGSVSSPNTLTLTIEGRNFGATQGTGSVSFGGSSSGIGYTSWSDTKIVVTVPAAALANASVDEVQVTDGSSNTSNQVPFYVTPAGTTVSAYTSNANTGADTASVDGAGPGTPGAISASMQGGATGNVIQVAQFTADPAMSSPSNPQDYFDTHLSGPTPTSVTVTDCTPGDSSLDWYSPGAGSWQTIQPAGTVTTVNGCLQAVLTGSTTPSLSNLNGTLFAGSSSPTAAYVSGLRVVRHGPRVVVRWRLAETRGVLGFNLSAGRHRLNRKLIPAHRSRMYLVSYRWTGYGPFRVGVVLRNGREVTVARA
jgi:hypothetical protein